MMDEAKLEQLARAIGITTDEEIDCTTCLELAPIYVDRELDGADMARELPEMQQHLALCKDCHEEYLALRDLAACERAGNLPDRQALLSEIALRLEDERS